MRLESVGGGSPRLQLGGLYNAKEICIPCSEERAFKDLVDANEMRKFKYNPYKFVPSHDLCTS